VTGQVKLVRTIFCPPGPLPFKKDSSISSSGGGFGRGGIFWCFCSGVPWCSDCRRDRPDETLSCAVKGIIRLGSPAEAARSRRCARAGALFMILGIIGKTLRVVTGGIDGPDYSSQAISRQDSVETSPIKVSGSSGVVLSLGRALNGKGQPVVRIWRWMSQAVLGSQHWCYVMWLGRVGNT
jgi:hypothetical protein